MSNLHGDDQPNHSDESITTTDNNTPLMLALAKSTITTTSAFDPSAALRTMSNDNVMMEDSFSSSAMRRESGVIQSRPTREIVLRRLSEALLRRSLTQIDLSQRGLLASDARLVKLAVLQNANLSVLKLGYNNLQDEGVMTLAPGISAHGALVSLDLGFNNVGDEGCKALAQAMQNQTASKSKAKGSLQTLYLAGNLIGEDGALALADVIRGGCSLRKLHLTGNRLGPDGVKALTDAISEDHIRRRNGFGNHNYNGHEKMSNGVFESNAGKCHDSGGMQELFLGGTKMGSPGCLAVAQMLKCNTSLRVLSLANCGIGDAELATLSKSIKENKEMLPLESLQLSFNDITCKGLETLMNAVWGSKVLCELRLDNNSIGDRGAQQVAAVLQSVTNLKVLDLGFNSIKSLGMKTLMKIVAETHHLVSLSISGNTIDTSAAKAVAYGLAYNRSLKSVFLDHCSISSEGQRHIAAGVVSNSQIALRKLTGFRIGPPIITIGLPPALEHWTNEQVLNFIQLMWEQSNQDKDQSITERELDPLQFLPDSGDGGGNRVSSGPLDPSIVVEVAKRAYASLGENGHDVFSRHRERPIEPSFESPLAGDAIVVESLGGNCVDEKYEQTSPAHGPNEFSGVPGLEKTGGQSPSSPLRSFVAAPAAAQSEPALPDPSRKRRIVEWLCKHIGHLNELAQLPFNSAELWRLHQHYFTPIVNESGGQIGVAEKPGANVADRIVSSVPEVLKGSEVTPSTQSYDDNASVPSSDRSLPPSPPVSSLPMLKRKVSYRFLGDAAVGGIGWSENRLKQTNGGKSVSRMIEDGALGHSMPPKTKRARRNRSRISFLPRIKAKLDSYLDVCHEKALILMRQLHFIERAILGGEINPCESSQSRTHLSGVLASEAEMILLDMM